MFIVRRLRQGASTEKGQTLVLVGVTMLVLLGLGAIAIDVGQVLWSRGAQQNIADAAALAGVRYLPDNPPGAVELATNYAELNYPSTESITVNAYVKSERYPNDTIVVDVRRTVQPWLRAAVGGGAIDVPAHAEAIVTTVQPRCNIFPFVIQQTITPVGMTDPVPYDSLYGTMVTLKIGAPGASVEGSLPSPGNFGLLDLTGTGIDGLPKVISDGGTCIADPSQPLDTLTGGKIGQIKPGFDGSSGPYGLPGLFVNTNPEPWPACPPEDGVVWTQADGRLIECTNGVPDNVYWDVSNTDNPQPAPTPPDTRKPWGLGSPSGPPGYDSGCNGPTANEPYPKVKVGGCPRVGFIPVIADGTWPTGSSGPITPVEWAAFYVIGTTNKGGGLSVVGSFLEQVWVSGGIPTWGDPNDAPMVGYFLWK